MPVKKTGSIMGTLAAYGQAGNVFKVSALYVKEFSSGLYQTWWA